MGYVDELMIARAWILVAAASNAASAASDLYRDLPRNRQDLEACRPPLFSFSGLGTARISNAFLVTSLLHARLGALRWACAALHGFPFCWAR